MKKKLSCVDELSAMLWHLDLQTTLWTSIPFRKSLILGWGLFDLHWYILIISNINTARFGRGPSSTCSTIPRPTFSTSSVGNSNPPAQPPLQRPGSAAPHLQVGILAILKVMTWWRQDSNWSWCHVCRWSTVLRKPCAPLTWWTDVGQIWSTGCETTLTRWASHRSQSQTQVLTLTPWHQLHYALKRFENLSLFFKSHFKHLSLILILNTLVLFIA